MPAFDAGNPAAQPAAAAGHAGDRQAGDSACAVLHPELPRIARARLRVHRAPTLLDTRALAHESLLRFAGGSLQVAQSRNNSHACAAKAMRHIAIDFARRAQADKRGTLLQPAIFDTALLIALPDPAATALPKPRR